MHQRKETQQEFTKTAKSETLTIRRASESVSVGASVCVSCGSRRIKNESLNCPRASDSMFSLGASDKNKRKQHSDKERESSRIKLMIPPSKMHPESALNVTSPTLTVFFPGRVAARSQSSSRLKSVHKKNKNGRGKWRRIPGGFFECSIPLLGQRAKWDKTCHSDASLSSTVPCYF